jgi:hypothetical protein
MRVRFAARVAPATPATVGRCCRKVPSAWCMMKVMGTALWHNWTSRNSGSQLIERIYFMTASDATFAGNLSLDQFQIFAMRSTLILQISFFLSFVPTSIGRRLIW